MSAPFMTDIASAAIEPNNRSEGFSFPKRFPRKDLFETEIKNWMILLYRIQVFDY